MGSRSSFGNCEDVEITIETNGAVDVASAVKRACAELVARFTSIRTELAAAVVRSRLHHGRER